MRRTWIILCGVVLAGVGFGPGAGCSRSRHEGAELDRLADAPIVRNRTTERELRDLLGEPDSSTRQGDGNKVLVWRDVRTRPGQAGVPTMTASTRTQVDTRTLTVTVRDGVVVDHRYTVGTTEP